MLNKKEEWYVFWKALALTSFVMMLFMVAVIKICSPMYKPTIVYYEPDKEYLDRLVDKKLGEFSIYLSLEERVSELESNRWYGE